MSTELAVVSKNQFLSLDPKGEYAEALQAMNDAGESITPVDLIRVKVPSGGGTTWMVPGPSGEEAAKSLRGALVFYQQAGVVWPSEDVQNGTMPALKTWDLMVAEQVGPVPDDLQSMIDPFRIDERRYRWPEMYERFGFGQDKRFKEQRMLFLLREQDLFPLLITVPPGSLKDFKKWFKQLPLARIPYYRAVVDLSLKKAQSRSGITYAQIVPTLVGQLDRETGEILKSKWTDQLSRIAKEVDLDATDDE